MAPKHPYIASTLERIAAGTAYNAKEYFFYKEPDIEDRTPVTQENHDQDTALKLARTFQEMKEEKLIPRLPTLAGDRFLEATKESVIKAFQKDVSLVPQELANQLLLRHIERQQIHMYRQIAIDALAECDDLKDILEKERKMLEEERREVDEERQKAKITRKELREQLRVLSSSAQKPPAQKTPRQRLLRHTILPSTPRNPPPPAGSVSSDSELEDSRIPKPAPSPFRPTGHSDAQSASRRSVKFPDPPTLSDGKSTTTFDQWRSHMENKLRSNKDWFIGENLQDTQERIAAYMTTCQPIDSEFLMDTMEQSFGDPYKEEKAVGNRVPRFWHVEQ